MKANRITILLTVLFIGSLMSCSCTEGDNITFDGITGYPSAYLNYVDNSTGFISQSPRFYIRDIVSDGGWQKMTAKGKETYGADGFKVSFSSSVDSKESAFDSFIISNSGKKERCITLVAAFPAPGVMTHSFNALDSASVIGTDEISPALDCEAGMKRLNNFPLQGVGNDDIEIWLGIDPDFPAVYRTFYNPETRELCMAFDLGFIEQQSEYELRLCRYTQEAGKGLSYAWKRYSELYPAAFEVKSPLMGNWMAFANISGVRNYEDFGFAFKEGTNDVPWEDAHGFISFKYTEPMTWWMKMDLPDSLSGEGVEKQRILRYGEQYAAQLASQGDAYALTFAKSIIRDADGNPVGDYQDTPWCKGICWSMSDLPGLATNGKEGASMFRNHWKVDYAKANYLDHHFDRIPGEGCDGEYIDSSEGYCIADLDFNREHLPYVTTPLTFSLDHKRPAIFKGLALYEFCKAVSSDVHSSGKLMMANSTPDKFSWLAPMFDVLGTENNWHKKNVWKPSTVERLQYRRMLCYGKPYCFIHNTDFSTFTPDLVEKYMMRSVAFGLFPGFFSANSSTGHYFETPELYERDRPLFKKYMPLCIALAQAGWEPVTGVSASDSRLTVERFGNPDEDGGKYYLTVFNSTCEPIDYDLIFNDSGLKGSVRALLGGYSIEPEHLAVFEISQ